MYQYHIAQKAMAIPYHCRLSRRNYMVHHIQNNRKYPLALLSLWLAWDGRTSKCQVCWGLHVGGLQLGVTEVKFASLDPVHALSLASCPIGIWDNVPPRRWQSLQSRCHMDQDCAMRKASGVCLPEFQEEKSEDKALTSMLALALLSVHDWLTHHVSHIHSISVPSTMLSDVPSDMPYMMPLDRPWWHAICHHKCLQLCHWQWHPSAQ